MRPARIPSFENVIGKVPEIFMLVATLADAKGLKFSDLKKLKGCWEFEAGSFHFGLNGHHKTVLDSYEDIVQPSNLIIHKGDKPIGLISPLAGEIIQEQGKPNPEPEIIAALKEAITNARSRQ